MVEAPQVQVRVQARVQVQQGWGVRRLVLPPGRG